MMAKHSIDELVKKIDALGNLTEPKAEQLPRYFFECYCRANEMYRVPISEYSCGVQEFVHKAVKDTYVMLLKLYKEDNSVCLCLDSEQSQRFTREIGEKLYSH
jgi:hypothetical protein